MDVPELGLRAGGRGGGAVEAGGGSGWWVNVSSATALGVAKAKQGMELRLALCWVMHLKVSEDGSWEWKQLTDEVTPA